MVEKLTHASCLFLVGSQETRGFSEFTTTSLWMDQGMWDSPAKKSCHRVHHILAVDPTGPHRSNRNNDPYFQQCSINSSGNASFRMSKMVVLRDKSRQVAVCYKMIDDSYLMGKYKIFSPKQLYPGQPPAQTIGGTILFRWARVVCSEFTTTLQIWNGSCYNAIYTSECNKDTQTTVLMNLKGQPVGTVQSSTMGAVNGWHIDVSPDINRVLVLCFTAILDDVEFSNPRDNMLRSNTV
jgi:hypothetical protein